MPFIFVVELIQGRVVKKHYTQVAVKSIELLPSDLLFNKAKLLTKCTSMQRTRLLNLTLVAKLIA